jgi:hypothetical protein
MLLLSLACCSSSPGSPGSMRKVGVYRAGFRRRVCGRPSKSCITGTGLRLILLSHLLRPGFLLGWFSNLKMEVIHSSQTPLTYILHDAISQKMAIHNKFLSRRRTHAAKPDTPRPRSSRTDVCSVSLLQAALSRQFVVWRHRRNELCH